MDMLENESVKKETKKRSRNKVSVAIDELKNMLVENQEAFKYSNVQKTSSTIEVIHEVKKLLQANIDNFLEGYRSCLFRLKQKVIAYSDQDTLSKSALTNIITKLSEEQRASTSKEETTPILSIDQSMDKVFEVSVIVQPSQKSKLISLEDVLPPENETDINHNNLTSSTEDQENKRKKTKRVLLKKKKSCPLPKKKKRLGSDDSGIGVDNCDSIIDYRVTNRLLKTTAIPEVKISIANTSSTFTSSYKIATSLPQLESPPNLFHPHFVMQRKMLSMGKKFETRWLEENDSENDKQCKNEEEKSQDESKEINQKTDLNNDDDNDDDISFFTDIVNNNFSGNSIPDQDNELLQSTDQSFLPPVTVFL